MPASPVPRAGVRCPVRTITAGVDLASLDDLAPVEAALDLLDRARARFEEEGFVVQTRRLSLPPLLAGLSPAERWTSVARVRRLDALAGERGALLSVGPVWTGEGYDRKLAGWIADLNGAAPHTHASVTIASAGGVHRAGARVAAEAMAAIAAASPAGLGNFRFAAAANVPAGTPFFPVAHHHGAPGLSIGLQSAALVGRALAGLRDESDATRGVVAGLGPVLMGVERIADDIAQHERVAYVGIDTSPAPLGDDSIGAAIETLTKRPFGSAGTLDACARVTAGLRQLPVRACGYSGLMLPVLEDRVLAARAAEERYGVRDLLLFSSVCGTGLDVVPLPGATPVDTIAGLLTDVAALSTRWQKALSARLLLLPGRQAGEHVSFDDPLLTACRVLPVDGAAAE